MERILLCKPKMSGREIDSFKAAPLTTNGCTDETHSSFDDSRHIDNSTGLFFLDYQKDIVTLKLQTPVRNYVAVATPDHHHQRTFRQ